MKEAIKHINNYYKEKDGKRYILSKSEVRNVNIKDSDFNLLYEEVFENDADTASENGLLINNDNDFIYIDCERMYWYIQSNFLEWKLEEYYESFDDWTFGNRLKKLIQIFKENVGFKIYY